ncbi:hypothetical protein EDD22DRAFT_847256 [Suillus occidentalis]|nr:hypothetical protein EDD22DRAFT_847256 [Suillus occidentalis]
MRFMIISDSRYRESFESTGSVGSTGTFGPAPNPSQPTLVLSPSQIDWRSTIQMATSSQMMDMLGRLEGKMEQLLQSTNGLQESIDGMEGRLTAHATKIVTLKAEFKNDLKGHHEELSSQINGIKAEVQELEKRFNERFDELIIVAGYVPPVALPQSVICVAVWTTS